MNTIIEQFYSCPCGRGEYGLCVNCPYSSCTAHEKIVFLDVDGPLIPWDCKPERRPTGYQTIRWRESPRFTSSGVFLLDNGRRRIWLNPKHGTALAKIRARLVWATAWGEEANARIGPFIGLPELPVATPTATYGYRGPARSWKTEILLEYAAGRPFAWVDDEIYNQDVLRITSQVRTHVLLLPVDPKYGLELADFSALRRWAELPAGFPQVEVAAHRMKLVLRGRVKR